MPQIIFVICSVDGCACGHCQLFEGCHQILCDRTWNAFTDGPAIGLCDWSNLGGRSGDKDLISCVEIKQAQVPLQDFIPFGLGDLDDSFLVIPFRLLRCVAYRSFHF